MILTDAKGNVDEVCSEVQRTVSSMKEKENGPEGIVFKKTQDSLLLAPVTYTQRDEQADRKYQF